MFSKLNSTCLSILAATLLVVGAVVSWSCSAPPAAAPPDSASLVGKTAEEVRQQLGVPARVVPIAKTSDTSGTSVIADRTLWVYDRGYSTPFHVYFENGVVVEVSLYP